MLALWDGSVYLYKRMFAGGYLCDASFVEHLATANLYGVQMI